MKLSVIIAAGGKGERFRKSSSGKINVVKIFLPLNQEPLLLHSLRALDNLKETLEIIVAAPKEEIPVLKKDIIEKYAFKNTLKVVPGGETRADSVYAGLKESDAASDYVLVHDGARPLIKTPTAEKLIKQAGNFDGAVLARKVVPTLKRVEAGTVTATVDRGNLWEAETPQLFKKDILERAYENYFREKFEATDTASLVEKVGGKITVFEAVEENLKVTTYADYKKAEKLMSCQKTRVVGYGNDFHRLVEDKELYIGGVLIPSPKGALGHSDGDPIIHAIIDAMLGAQGLGDIGDKFPDSSVKFKNVRSTVLLEETLRISEKNGYRPVNVDTTVIIEKPKLSEYKTKMKDVLASTLKLDPERVNVKAKTGEGAGPEGAGVAVSAQAVVLMEKLTANEQRSLKWSE